MTKIKLLSTFRLAAQECCELKCAEMCCKLKCAEMCCKLKCAEMCCELKVLVSAWTFFKYLGNQDELEKP